MPMQSYAGANDISGPEMSGELAVVERTATVVSTIARSPANSLTSSLRAASADDPSLSQENKQMMKGLHRLRLLCGNIVCSHVGGCNIRLCEGKSYFEHGIRNN